VDVASALKADPAKTSQLAQSISDWPMSSEKYFKSVQDRVGALFASKQLSIFGSGYWGHPAYRLPPEANLMAVAHYLEALQLQKEFIRIHAVLGGKNPHLQSFLVGGMSTAMDPNEPDATINPERIDFLLQVARSAIAFVSQVYVPDVLAVAGFYREWFDLGAGIGNYMSYGGYPQSSVKDPASFVLPRGIILNRDLSNVHPVDTAKIKEYVTRSWYEYSGGDQTAKHPFDGETDPKYSGPKPPYEFLNVDEKYSWIKAPRYEDQPMEVGPLARMLVAYASGQPDVKKMVDSALAKLNVPLTSLFSTLGRIAARALETQLLGDLNVGWIEQLGANLASGNVRIHNGEKWDPGSWPKSARGLGFFEAPRGSLGHWVEIEDRAIKNYQAVVPSTWNAGPRDGHGQRGPYEAGLLKTPIADPDRPLELMRTVHSFDPCLACAVHVVDARGHVCARAKG
jgi:hydrogenase large subunit